MFIARRPDDSIYGAWTVRQWEGQEEMADNHPDLIAFLAPRPPVDLSNLDNVTDKVVKAVGLLMRDYCNALLAGTYTTKSIAQLKADFAAKYQSLP